MTYKRKGSTRILSLRSWNVVLVFSKFVMFSCFPYDQIKLKSWFSFEQLSSVKTGQYLYGGPVENTGTVSKNWVQNKLSIE